MAHPLVIERRDAVIHSKIRHVEAVVDIQVFIQRIVPIENQRYVVCAYIENVKRVLRIPIKRIRIDATSDFYAIEQRLEAIEVFISGEGEHFAGDPVDYGKWTAAHRRSISHDPSRWLDIGKGMGQSCHKRKIDFRKLDLKATCIGGADAADVSR